MLAALTWLLLYQLTGEILVHVLDIPVPGPVIGMALLFLTLVIRGYGERPIPRALQQTANTLLQHLSLLFVPAGTGVMLYLQLIMDEWLPISVALIISTIGGMTITALILRALTRKNAEAQNA
jgi:holin-like protein